MKSGLIRRFRRLVPLLLVVVLGWWGYTTFLSPPEDVITRSHVTNDATQHLMEHDWAAALATIDTGLTALPGDWELLVWQSVLLEKLGRSGQASLAQAEKQAAPVEVSITLGTVSMMINWPEKTQAVGEQLIKQAPDLPHGYYFQARAYELTGQLAKALQAYRDAEKRAANNPDYDGIFVAARERIFALSNLQP